MRRRAFPLVVAVVLAVGPAIAAPASATDVHLVLIASGTNWHVASTGSAPKPTVTVTPGDVLHLQVHNHDPTAHTFTFPHFSIDEPLAPGSDADPTIILVNITTSAADNGKWQFYCRIPGHTTGTDPNRDGMVGWVQVGTPPAPGLEVPLILAVLGMGAVAVRGLRRRTR